MEDDLASLSLNDDSNQYSIPTEECTVCSGINFEAYFSVEGSHDAVPSITVMDADRSQTGCPFCGLLMQAAGQFTHPGRVIPWRDNQPLAFYFERQYRAPVYNQDFGNVVQRGGAVMRVRLWPTPSPIPEGTAIEFVLCPIFIHDDVHEAQDSARFVLEDRIDLAVCREWLRDCESRHLGDCVSPGPGVAAEFPPDMRVIDVVDRYIIPALSNCRCGY